jgi:hypothetical protein
MVNSQAKEGVWACRACAAGDRWAFDLLDRLGQPKTQIELLHAEPA